VAGAAATLALPCGSAVRVAFVPGEAFGTPGYARFSFAMGDDDIVEGITRIGKLLG